MKTAVITLDIINEICATRGKLARYADRIERHHIIERINTITAWGRKKSHLIAHVRVGFRASYLDASTLSPLFKQAEPNQALRVDAWGGQFCEELQIEPEDIQIIKKRVSAFYGTELDLILRANRVEELILVGVATNNALELTAREAHDRDFRVKVIEDATECANDEEKQASLHFLARLCEVLPTQQLIA